MLATFAVSGLWHGAGYNFLIWGLLNGILVTPFILAAKARGSRGTADAPAGGLTATARRWAATVATFVAICITWVFFRARTPADAWTILSRIVTCPWPGPRSLTGNAGWSGEPAMILLILTLITIEWLTCRRTHPLTITDALPRPVRWCGYTAVFWAILYGMPMTTSSFIYFQF